MKPTYHVRSASAGRKSGAFSLGSGSALSLRGRKIMSRALSGLRLLHGLVVAPAEAGLVGVEEELTLSSAVCSDGVVAVSPLAGVEKELKPVPAAVSGMVAVVFSAAVVEARREAAVGSTVAVDTVGNEACVQAEDGERFANAFSMVSCAGMISATDMIEEGLTRSTDSLNGGAAVSTFGLYPLPPGAVEMSGGGVTDGWSTIPGGNLSSPASE